MLADVIERLVEGAALTREGQVLAETLRSAARLADDDEATPAGRLRAQQNVVELLDRWSDLGAGPDLPRIGRLTGEQARAVGLAIGYPVEQIDTLDLPFGFDCVEALALRRARRLAGLPEQPCLDVMVADARRAA